VVRLDRLCPLHSLRHSAFTGVYWATPDLILAQQLTRHASPLTTVIYTHPSDEEVLQTLRRINC